jgi:serine/threonine protein kinase
MAPEQLLGKPPQAASDVYSLGVLIWEVITCRLPFHGEFPDTKRLIAGVTTDNKRPSLSVLPRDTPPGVIDLLKVCWSVQASKRPIMPAVLQQLESLQRFVGAVVKKSQTSEVGSESEEMSLKHRQLYREPLLERPSAHSNLAGSDLTGSASSKGDDCDAQFARGKSCEEIGRHSDAMKCYSLAAKQGHAAAMSSYGWGLAQGWNGKADVAQAVLWYKRAAAQASHMICNLYNMCACAQARYSAGLHTQWHLD